ncbi:MAG: YcxB family protein [Bacillota bacterium]|nr:YcxB family protein [Bacillota bacterium]
MENETLINYEAYKKYYLFSLFKGKHYKSKPRLYYIISSVGIVISLATGFAFGFDILIKTFLSIFIFLTLLMSLLIFYLPKKYYKSAEKMYEGVNQYKFFEDYFTVEKNTDEAKGNSQIKYSALYKIYEVQDYFYIFISRSQAYMVDKSRFNTSEPETLREIFKDKLGKKYYKYC